ncbi:MAG: DNA polymerase III subunit gamma/tau [Clostridiales bacterium]|nr:DNA polymerase III subunit gamma/tau [Clostridiales bacterium]
MATLYRKYRSQRFDDVIGQDPIVTTLTNQIKLGRISHAYLFTGSRGVGKTSCARIFARAVNCLHPVNGSPCGECEVCKSLAADNVDIIEMDAASNNGVDDARDIREKVKYLPVSCKYKVYIIDEVHMLTGGAFNALLKTIEEPPEHVIFILATTEPQKLPQTILSRCIRFDFRLVPTDILAKHIAHIYDLEGIKYTPEAAEEIARLGEGSVRDALSVADTLASAAEVVTPELVLALTGAGETASIAELFERTAERDLAGVLSSIDGFAKRGKSVAAVCRQLIDYTRNVIVAKSVGKEKAINGGMINADRAALERIIAAADKYSMQDIARILEELGVAENGLKYSVNPRVFLETSLVKLVCDSLREDDLLRRIAALENNSVGLPSEQKKNKVISCGESAPTRSSISAPVAKTDDGFVKTAAPVKSEATVSRIDDFAPPPEPEYYPEPEYIPPVTERVGYTKYGDTAKKQEPIASKPDISQINVTTADEGEFKHIGASKEEGRELLGKIAIALRRAATPAADRARRLLSRGVAVKEREDAIGFVTPDDSFLSMSEGVVLDVLNGVLNSLGIKKHARIERTADDLFEDDFAHAVELFGRDCTFRE